MEYHCELGFGSQVAAAGDMDEIDAMRVRQQVNVESC